jgi:integrase
VAKQYSFVYRNYGLGGVNGEACAIKLDANGKRESRHKLYAPRLPENAARAALIAFVDGIEIANAKGDPSICQVLDWYAEKLASEGKKPNGVLRPGNMLQIAFAGLNVSAISEDLCKQAARDWEATYKPWTIWKALNQLRAAVKWSEKGKGVPHGTHLRVWNIMTPPGRERTLTPDEFRSLLDACKSEHVRLFCLLLLYTAQRPEAVCHLTWDRVDFDARIIDFNEKRVPRDITDKKGMKGRAVVNIVSPILGPLRVAKEKARTGRVIEDRGRIVNRVTRGFTEARKAAGLGRDVTPHILRHTAATLAAADGNVSELSASKFLGHSDPGTTRKTYIHTKAEAAAPAQQAVVDKMVQALRITRIK